MTEAKAPQGLDMGWAKPLIVSAPIGFGAQPDRRDSESLILGPEDHTLTFAPTGAGKGTTSIIPLLLTHTGPAIVFDPKGEAAHVTAAWRKSQGHEVFVIDPMGVTGLPQAQFNPFDLIDLSRADAYDEARSLADCLLMDRTDPRNHFWLNQARQLLTAAILQTATNGAGLASVGQFVTLCDMFSPGGDNWMQGSSVREVQSIAGMADLGATETQGSVLHFVMEAAETLRSAPIQASMGPSAFKISDLIQGRPMTVYFVLPSHMLRSHARLVRIWFGSLIQIMARRARAPKSPTLFVIDEASQLGSLEAFVTMMTLMRGYGVQCASYWQDPAQLIAAYPQDWQTIRNNAAHITAFGQKGQAAMRELEQFLGIDTGVLTSMIGQRLCQVQGQLTRTQTRSYLNDPDLKARAQQNPYHAAHKGPIERPAPKAVRREIAPRRARSHARTTTGDAIIAKAINVGLAEVFDKTSNDEVPF